MELRLLSDVTLESSVGQEWEVLVQTNPASGIMQSLHWAEVKRRQGLKSVHFGVFDQGALRGGALFYVTTRTPGAGLMVAPEGPVLPWSDVQSSTEMMRLILDAAAEYAAANGVMSMRVEPRLVAPLPAMLREFGRAPADLVPRETLYLDIAGERDLLLSSMKPKGRYNIKLATHHNVRVVESTDKNAVMPFYTAVSEAAVRDDFTLERRSFFEELSAVLCSSGNGRFLFAYHEGDLLGSLFLTTYGERATYLYGGITNTKRNLMGGYALQWTAIECARSAGCRIYDFYGYVPHRSPEHNYARFSQFKSQFGGQPVRFIGAHEYFFLDNVADVFMRAVQEISAKSTVVLNRQGETVPC
jgi:lipid II:glycine glycyltransferase (peptidoglycan interpeptide bridge formation enzyme)